MRVETRAGEDVAVVEVEGSLDSRTAPEVEAGLETVLHEHRRVLMDMTRLSYLSSAGLRLLLVLYRQGTGTGTRIALVGVSPEIHEVMTATGFASFFQILDTVDEGVAELTS